MSKLDILGQRFFRINYRYEKRHAYKMLSLKKTYDRETLLYYEEQYYIKVLVI